MAHFKTSAITEKENEALKRDAERNNRSRQKHIEYLIKQHAQKVIKKGE